MLAVSLHGQGSRGAIAGSLSAVRTFLGQPYKDAFILVYIKYFFAIFSFRF